MCLCVNAWGGCWSALAVVGVVCWCDARLMLCVRMCVRAWMCICVCVCVYTSVSYILQLTQKSRAPAGCCQGNLAHKAPGLKCFICGQVRLFVRLSRQREAKQQTEHTATYGRGVLCAALWVSR